MIANDTFAASFGTVPAGDEESLAQVARAACRNGFAVVVNKPGGKEPLCTLTARAAKQADNAARAAAREAGDPRWERRRHACGIAHAMTDAEKAATVVRRLVKTYGAVNLGVEVGRSGYLVIDADTADQKAAFRAAWSAAVGEDMGEKQPTVLSPGKVRVSEDGSERWVHKDGGHYWFALPEGVDLTALPGKGILTAEEGWVAIWKDKQVIVPPSVRAEGAYRLVGQVEDAPRWLLDRVFMMAAAHVERQRIQRERVRFDGDPIDGWSAATPWADLLGPDGWTDTGLPDSCDCPIWTRPGDDASHYKSATAHELGCTKYDMTTGHGPLHLWTDNPPEFLRVSGLGTVSKLQYVAWRDYAGDMGAAMRAIGLAAMGDEPLSFDGLWDAGTARAAAEAATEAAPADDGDDDEAGPGEDEPTEPAEYVEFRKVLDDENMPAWLRRDVGEQWRREYVFDLYRRLKNRGSRDEIRERMRAAVDRLSDVGEDTDDDLWRIEGLWMQSQVVMLSAKYKAGKTTMVTNVIKTLVDGTPFLGRFACEPIEGTVFVVNAEMTRRQFNRWMYESPIVNRHKVVAFHVRDAGSASGDILDATRREELIAVLIEHDARVLILDPLNPLFAASGVDEDKSSQVAPWFNALADIIERTRVAEVLLVHHFGHNGSRGRGSSKLMDAPDVLWTYTVEERAAKPEDDMEDLLGAIEAAGDPRYLAAIGRDVDLPKSLVTFDRATRSLSISECGEPAVSPAESQRAKARRAHGALVRRFAEEVAETPGLSFNALRERIGSKRSAVAAARDEAVTTGLIRAEPNPKNRGELYFPVSKEV